MILDVFVMTFIAAFVFTVVVFVEFKAWFMHILGAMAWMFVTANSVYITVPGDTSYSEWGLNAFCLVFVFLHIIFAILEFNEWRHQGTLPY